MKKILLSCLILFFAATSHAQYNKNSLTPSMSVGLDLSQRYIIAANGSGAGDRANMNMGIDYRYFTNDNINFGLRYSFDIEEQAGTSRQMMLAPGFQYQWFQGQTWMPYVRSDIPVVLNTDRDVGFDAGLGLAWNLGNQIGLNNMLLRYDFTVQYLFGLGSAVDVLSVEFFKVGLDYRF